MPRKRKDQDDGGIAIAPPPPPVENDGGEDKPQKPKPIEFIEIRTQKQPWGFLLYIPEKYSERYAEHRNDERYYAGGVLPETEYGVGYLFSTIQAVHVHAQAVGIEPGHYEAIAMHIGKSYDSGPAECDEDDED